MPTPTLLVSTVIGIDSSSGKPTGSSQTSALKKCREVGGRRERESSYLFHSSLRPFCMGYERISYFNQKKAASVFAAYCGIALQETRVSHGVKNFALTSAFLH